MNALEFTLTAGLFKCEVCSIAVHYVTSGGPSTCRYGCQRDHGDGRGFVPASLLRWEQPFGFTRADVQYLHGAIGFVTLAGGNPDMLESLATKLAALLP